MNTYSIPRIRLLNRLLANQIAAGEVVERPASVVKELLENSIDAHATQIEVILQQSGFHQIKVRDNGCGIEQADLRLAVCRHATSKIATVEDLSHIDTLGFRGEALASIAAVSRFWLSSKPAQQTQAWQVHLNGLDTEVELQPTAHPTGTTVVVEDLFFNTPARRKFLRSERTEYLQIEEVFKRVALSHLDIGFSLTHNQRMIYRLLPAVTETQQQRRIAKIFGSNFIEQACKIERQATGLSLTGWLGLPSLSRSQNDLQYVYLNGRLVRDRVINHALRQAYEDILPAGRNALYLLYLTVDPTMVDVNVHPTKHEVRFHQARLVHDFLVSTLTKALSPTTLPSEGVERASPSLEVCEPDLSMQMVQPLFSCVAEPESAYAQQTDRAEQSRVQMPLQVTETAAHNWGKALAYLQNRWLLSEVEEGILFIDTHAAWRFVCSQRLTEAHANHTICAQPLLFPHTHTLSTEILTRLFSQQEKLLQLGIGLDQLSATAIIIRTLPLILQEFDSLAFLLALNQHLQQKSSLKVLELLSLSCQFIKPVILTTLTAQQAFLNDLACYISMPNKFCRLVKYQELKSMALT